MWFLCQPTQQRPVQGRLFSTTLVLNMSRRLSSWFVLCLLSLFAAHARPPLAVAAAADLSVIGPELQHSFAKMYPNAQTKMSFGSSAMLTQQVRQGAPFDVFLSANSQFVEDLAKEGKLDGKTVRAYATGRLGLVWKDGGKHPIRELGTAHVRVVALPNPKLAPYGVAAQQALEYGGLWTVVQPKIVYGENVRQTLQFLDSGNADAVITADSLLGGRNVEVLPFEWHKPVIQKGGVVSVSKNAALAQQFIDFLLSAEGQAIFARFGFGAPPQ